MMAKRVIPVMVFGIVAAYLVMVVYMVARVWVYG